MYEGTLSIGVTAIAASPMRVQLGLMGTLSNGFSLACFSQYFSKKLLCPRGSASHLHATHKRLC